MRDKRKKIHLTSVDYRWMATWQYRGARITRFSSSPEMALVVLIACGPNDGIVQLPLSSLIYHKFTSWVLKNGLMDLRRRLLYAKGDGWDRERLDEAVRVYREWRREQTSGTSLGLGE